MKLGGGWTSDIGCSMIEECDPQPEIKDCTEF